MRTYDGAILDIMMPKKDGLTVLKEIRRQGNNIPVLMLTAKAEIDDRVLGLDSGANDYLTKPFAAPELLARIRAMTRTQMTLTKNLIYLAKMEEGENQTQMIDFPLSEVISETAATFQALARTESKQFALQIQPMLSFYGDEDNLRKLTSILLDNALKYSDENGFIQLNLEKKANISNCLS